LPAVEPGFPARRKKIPISSGQLYHWARPSVRARFRAAGKPPSTSAGCLTLPTADFCFQDLSFLLFRRVVNFATPLACGTPHAESGNINRCESSMLLAPFRQATTSVTRTARWTRLKCQATLACSFHPVRVCLGTEVARLLVRSTPDRATTVFSR